MVDFIVQQHRFWLLILGILTVVSAIEVFSDRSARVSIADRLFNIGAGSFYLIVGGYMALLILSRLSDLHLFRDSSLNTVAYTILFVLLQDLIYYFFHRLQHGWPLLWEIHKLHHTDTDVNVTTSYRTHVIEQPIQTLLIFVPIIMVLGFDPAGVVYGFYFSMFFLYFGHSRLDLPLGPFSGFLVGPQFHRVHHSLDAPHLNKNFAQFFPFIDRLFGTHVQPRSVGEIQTGVRECTSRKAQFAPAIWPLSAILGAGKTRAP